MYQIKIYQIKLSMSSFITNMQEKAELSQNELLEKTKQNELEKDKIFQEKKHVLMVKLTELYHEKLVKAITQASSKGERVKYMNFTYEDFKANLHGIGKPSDVQSVWLSEMSNSESKYLKKDDCEDLVCLEGLKWNIWGNRKFTTLFEW